MGNFEQLMVEFEKDSLAKKEVLAKQALIDEAMGILKPTENRVVRDTSKRQFIAPFADVPIGVNGARIDAYVTLLEFRDRNPRLYVGLKIDPVDDTDADNSIDLLALEGGTASDGPKFHHNDGEFPETGTNDFKMLANVITRLSEAKAAETAQTANAA